MKTFVYSYAQIKKEMQDAELNPEKLDKVAGGTEIEEFGELYKCPMCVGKQ